MAGPSLMESLFQRSLDDQIKGIRLFSGGAGESGFISKAIDEIRHEIKSVDPQTKATVLQKLTYLQSIHSVDEIRHEIKSIDPQTKATALQKLTYLHSIHGVDEIRHEIKSIDPQTKAMALQKLTYLHSIHDVDMSWAAFHAIELSSAQSFLYKRIAYLAATLSFDPSTTDDGGDGYQRLGRWSAPHKRNQKLIYY